MALGSQALVSLEEARTYLDVSSNDKPTDTLLELVIEGLSSALLERVGALYVNPAANDAASARIYDFLGGDRHVAIAATREIDKVEVTATPREADSWLELGDEEWIDEPGNGAPTTRIRFLTDTELPATGAGWGILSAHQQQVDSMRTRWPWQERVSVSSRGYVRVTGKLGLAGDESAIPANVKLACLMWLQNIHKRDQAFFSETIGVASALTRMPPDVEALLEGDEAKRSGVAAV